MKHNLATTLTLLATVGLVGCKDDPPPPPLPETTATAAKDTAGTASPAQGNVPRVSPVTMKIYRVDSCLLGAEGLRYLKEAYMASLDGKEPGPGALPSFGDYPGPAGARAPERETGAQAKAEAKATGGEPAAAGTGAPQAAGTGAPKAAGTGAPKAKTARRPASARRAPGQQVPFIRYLRACTIAKQLKEPAHAELDSALVEWDKFAGPISRSLLEATRYYGSKQYEKDDFARAKALHTTLTEAFPKLEEELGKLEKAVATFREEHPEPKEELDDAGKIAQTVVGEARSVALAFLEPEVDAESVKASVEKIAKAREELDAEGKKTATAPHPKVVAPKMAAFEEAVRDALEGDEQPDTRDRHLVIMATANLVDANQRAINMLVNRRGGAHKRTPPMRMLKPTMKGARPKLERQPTPRTK